MVSAKFDPLSPFNVRWATKLPTLIANGKQYILQEQSLPAANQLTFPPLADVQAKLTAVTNAEEAFQKSKAERTTQAGDFKTLFANAKPDLEKAFLQLKAKYAGKWQHLSQWGLTVKDTAKGYAVTKPTSTAQWLAFWQTYTDHETSLPPAERITDPALPTMVSRLQTTQAAKSGRTTAQATREAGALERDIAANELSELLQLACLNLIFKHYGGKIHSELQLWGFDVAASGSQPDGAPSGGGATP